MTITSGTINTFIVYNRLRVILIMGAFFLALFAGRVLAANTGDLVDFNVDKNFTPNEAPQVQAVLVKTDTNLNFYVEKNWWDLQVFAKQQETLAALANLSSEFNNH